VKCQGNGPDDAGEFSDGLGVGTRATKGWGRTRLIKSTGEARREVTL
jgi:hypothetical protein